MRSFYFGRWSDENAAVTKQMWWDGESYMAIRKAVNAKSERAVKEKIIREGFMRNPELAKINEARPYEIPFHRIPLVREDGSLVTIETVRNNECRYMYGEPSIDAPLCARVVVPDTCWCHKHFELTHDRSRPAMVI